MEQTNAAPNLFEISILHKMAEQFPVLSSFVPILAVRSRECTGVGTFTSLADLPPSSVDWCKGPLALEPHINMPGVQNGLGALLFFSRDGIATLEIFAYGDDVWTGNWEGYSIEANKV